MADGLSYLYVDTGQPAEFLAQFFRNLSSCAVAVLKGVRRLYLAGVYSETVFVELGTARLSCYGEYFRHIENDFLSLAAYAVALLKGDARKGGDVDGEGAFVERRQEAAPECGGQSQGHKE